MLRAPLCSTPTSLKFLSIMLCQLSRRYFRAKRGRSAVSCHLSEKSLTKYMELQTLPLISQRNKITHILLDFLNKFPSRYWRLERMYDHRIKVHIRDRYLLGQLQRSPKIHSTEDSQKRTTTTIARQNGKNLPRAMT